MTSCTKKILAVLLVCLAAACAPAADAVTIEPDPDLQRVMGDLYALSAAMRLFYDDTHLSRCPSLNDLAHYLKTPLPGGWPGDYRTDVIQGDWWVGRRVPEFSAARKFLRDNAPMLGLYDRESQSAWLGGAFVWMKGLSFEGKNRPSLDKIVIKAAQGEGADRQHLFFNSPGTNYYWRSSLIYTTGAHADTLRRFGTDAKGPFVLPPPPSPARETIAASPVALPENFTLSGEDETQTSLKLGDITINPLRRPREQ